MATTAYVETSVNMGDEESPPCLRFGHSGAGGGIVAIVHAVTAYDMLVEADVAFAPGMMVEVRLPHAGIVGATVAWVSGRLFFCQFEFPLSQATMGAAALKRAVVQYNIARRSGLEAASESLGCRILRLRTQAGLTQAEISAALGVSEPSVSAWERDKVRPLIGRLDALAQLLDVSRAELVGEEAGSENLADVLAWCRARISQALGVQVADVKISIDL